MDIVERMRRGEKIAIGMVHLLPLPGTLHYGGEIEPIIERAVEDACKLQATGFDAVIVENVNDAPHDMPQMSAWQISTFAVACDHVRRNIQLPIGIDACGDSLAGFMIGDCCGIEFIRVPYFVDIRIGSGGLINPNGARAVMLRKRNGLENIRIFADVQVKHTYALNPEIPIEASSRWAESVGADALIVTGMATGMETPIETLRRVKASTGLPVVVGSGMTERNAREQFSVCDGAIIGSSLKQNGDLMNPVDASLAERFMQAFREGSRE